MALLSGFPACHKHFSRSLELGRTFVRRAKLDGFWPVASGFACQWSRPSYVVIRLDSKIHMRKFESMKIYSHRAAYYRLQPIGCGAAAAPK